MLNENQIYVASSPKDFIPTGQDNTQNLSPVGTYTIQAVASNPWITGSNISGYAYVMSRESISSTINEESWAITLNDKNEFSWLYRPDEGDTELFCSGVNEDGDRDIYLPSGWYLSGGGQKFGLEINDRFFQQEIFNVGASDLSYKVTKDINLSYVENISDAQELEYNTFNGWEVDVKEEGIFSYYIKLNEYDTFNEDFVWIDNGPVFYISKYFIDAFYVRRDPSFDITDPKNIIFKKGRHVSGQSFSDRDYDSAPVIQPTGGTGILEFGDPSWFLNEAYIMKTIPSQSLFNDQQELSISEREGSSKPTRDELIQFEADSDLGLEPITGKYYFNNNKDGCLYAKSFFTTPESRNWNDDYRSSNDAFRDYLTVSNFIYNVIRVVDEYGIDIEGSSLDSFLVDRIGSNYRKTKTVSDFFKDAGKVKIAYNEGCNVFQRRFYYYGGSDAYVEWSLNHKNRNDNSKIHNSVYRRIYELDETFTYGDGTFSVVDFVPFADFGMEPIKWSK